MVEDKDGTTGGTGAPGGNLPEDPPADTGFVPDAGDGNFEVDLSTETPDIYVNPVDGSRSLFLDVRGVEGASENGFDVPLYYSSLV